MMKFEPKKSYEEIEVGDRILKLSFADADIKRYKAVFEEYDEDVKQAQKELKNGTSTEETEKTLFKAVEKLTDTIFTFGTFDYVYNDVCGGASDTFEDFMNIVGVMIDERRTEKAEKRKNEYLNAKLNK